MNETYDIVVAYRRGPRWAAATLIHQSLVHNNRRALIDHMNAGLGRPQTLAAVRVCRVFVLVLEPATSNAARPDGRRTARLDHRRVLLQLRRRAGVGRPVHL
ncbi:MAG: hypothetical protein HND48_20945 [Chloroflexi bacterium]|nr:hypothetical protein [Chloroflexota bacterium]